MMRVVWDQQKFEALLRADLLERRKRQLRRATNELAYRGVEALQDEMRRVFDRPTRWVLSGMNVIPMTGGANSTRAAVVDWKPGRGNKAIPAAKILRAQIEGGQRGQKRFEKALRLPADLVAVPARGTPLDAHGNLSPGLIVRILSDLRLFGEQGYRANRPAGKAGKYTILYRQIGRLPAGIYERAAGRVGRPKMVIAFVRAGTYRPRLNPREVIARMIERERDAVWQMALAGTLPKRTRGGRLVGGGAA
jgi:hypothetical protein